MIDDDDKNKGITPLRMSLWILGGAIGLYLIGSGLGRALGWF